MVEIGIGRVVGARRIGRMRENGKKARKRK